MVVVDDDDESSERVRVDKKKKERIGPESTVKATRTRLDEGDILHQPSTTLY